LLLAFSLIYDYFWAEKEHLIKPINKILAGCMIGLIAILVMYLSWTLKMGIVFDTRSILLSISGLFFGGIPTIIAMLFATIYRILMGGDGVWMGIAVIMSSGFIGLIWRIFFPPEKIKKPYFNILILGIVVHFSMFLCTLLLPKDAILITMRALALPLIFIYTPGTMLLGMLMLKRLQIRKTQKTKNEEESRYRILFENAGEAIVVAQDGVITFANQRISDILGISYEELKSQPFTSFIHPDDREMVLEKHLSRIQNIDTPSRYSFRSITRKNKIIWFDINSVSFEWNGKPASLSFLSDVTLRRETEKQLVLAKNKAEESDRLKTIFLANTSHEIRTPMNAILGFSDLLENKELDENKRDHYLKTIKTAGHQLMHIINDIIDISKLEVDQLNINKIDCKLLDIYTQSISVFRNSPLFKAKNTVNFVTHFPKPCENIMVHTDPYRIQQVLDNLLSNAIKYTEQGSIELSCKLENQEKLVVIHTSIKDTGIGIPKNKQDIIFKRFRQVEEDQYREGTGLGLSISKGIIDLMGGKIWFESTVNKGSTFHFSLEIEKANEVPMKTIIKQTSIPDLSGLHIIVAEDDLTSFYLIQEYLSDTHAKISHAPDGETLMNMLSENIPDIILLDINMPKKDGFTCIKEINEKNYDIKIIAQTAYAMENEKERCLSSGCEGYVSKPIDPAILYQEIQNILKH
jgi:hypothetical protein